MADEKAKAITTQNVVSADPKSEANTNVRKSQAEYDGNHHMDKVTVTITKDTKHYKKGAIDTVHPTVAAIMKEKGIIGDYKKDIKRYNAPKVVDGQLQNN